MQLGLLAGETSGDILGAALVRELGQRHKPLSLAGIGGPLLAESGLDSLYPMDRLSVMGLVDPLKRLPELLRVRDRVRLNMLAARPDCFLGIDSPDFNLTLERRLRREGITTAHLVSPSVWAWRSGRVRTIAESVDLMLCLLPFETAIYEAAGVPAVCVGHPLIEELAALPDRSATRAELAVADDAKVLAVLPGSRAGEVATLLPVFLPTLARLYVAEPGMQFLMPAANPDRRAQIEAALMPYELPVTVLDGQGRQAMQAADAVLLASGTATLEAMLLGRPMVIAYRMAWLSWHILKRMATTRFIGLPNVLAGEAVVPELLQEDATPEALAATVLDVFNTHGATQVARFETLSEQIGGNFPVRAADALDALIASRRKG